jgi:hypothetical protein
MDGGGYLPSDLLSRTPIEVFAAAVGKRDRALPEAIFPPGDASFAVATSWGHQI